MVHLNTDHINAPASKGVTCPHCGKGLSEPTRKEIYTQNAELLTAREWIDGGCGTLKEWVCLRLDRRVKTKVDEADEANRGNRED